MPARLIFLFFLLPVLLPAQATGWSYFDTLPAGITRITLPQAKSNYSYRGSEFVITNDADYKAQFPDSVKSKLPKIDFTRHELLGKSYCMQCAISCDGHPQCHRNACRYSRSWFLLEKRSRIKIMADTLKGKDCHHFSADADEFICRDDSSFSILQKSCPELKNDTIDFNKRVVVARGIYLDCAAHVKQEFYLDTIQKCMVWRLYSGYGGCHGMLARYFIFSLPKPPDGYQIRLEKYALSKED
jgi:hypothetical protein